MCTFGVWPSVSCVFACACVWAVYVCAHLWWYALQCCALCGACAPFDVLCCVCRGASDFVCRRLGWFDSAGGAYSTARRYDDVVAVLGGLLNSGLVDHYTEAGGDVRRDDDES